ncbi:RHD3/Sey1 [Thamnocephalis sphaerospora]|uniref:RHD3/Sey1 n=1 Tax=Thamnocephalis sphaerospora TaxID=78915 RepID=A0A4P9XFY3_9FUNG|nr:RHD3/Sey1 [Thamnocephalis sphaerospora]|eukprot:RKP04492.1 RHD3/Sey1 [Thamnocephalis sphaerospora]
MTMIDILSALGTLFEALCGVKPPFLNANSESFTNKGIWMGKIVDANVLVMEAEVLYWWSSFKNLSHRTRNAAFAVATAGVFVISVLENDIDCSRSHIINMLQYLFNQHLMILGKWHKSLLLFVVVDYTGDKYLEDLYFALRDMVREAWDNVSKPDDLKECFMDDFFDCDFFNFPAESVAPDRLSTFAAGLRARCSSKRVFKPCYWKLVSVEQLIPHMKALRDTIGKNNQPACRPEDIWPCRNNSDHTDCFYNVNANHFCNKFSESVKWLQKSIGKEEVCERLAARILGCYHNEMSAFEATMLHHSGSNSIERDEFRKKCYETARSLFRTHEDWKSLNSAWKLWNKPSANKLHILEYKNLV